jgi:hypothetical protein
MYFSVSLLDLGSGITLSSKGGSWLPIRKVA